MSRYSSRSSAGTGCKVYVGGLTQNASKEEIEDVFERYGRLRSVFVARNPPGFAFIEFDDPIDAEDSVKALDGRLICGTRVKVELSHGKVRVKNFERGGPLGRDPRDRRLDSRDYPRRDYQRSYRDDAPRRSRYLLSITLSLCCSQDVSSKSCHKLWNTLLKLNIVCLFFFTKIFHKFSFLNNSTLYIMK